MDHETLKVCRSSICISITGLQIDRQILLTAYYYYNKTIANIILYLNQNFEIGNPFTIYRKTLVIILKKKFVVKLIT